MQDRPLRFDPEALVAQTAWVRALVRTLVRPDRVDDVVQDALLAALERPPRAAAQPGRLRAWLAVVARNAALGLARGESRRRAREQAGAQPDATEATHRIVERTALHARVVQAVLALEEPQRTTVLLRYFDGLSSAAIARRLGVPAATVRQRLARGLRRLRAELNVDEGGSTSAELALLLVPGAGRPAGLTPVLQAVLATAGVALLLTATWQLPAARKLGGGAAIPALAGSIVPVTTGAAPGASAALRPPTPSRASLGRTGVTLSVVDGQSLQPLAGARVTRAVGRDHAGLVQTLAEQWRAAGIHDSAPRWVYLSGEPAVPPAPGEGQRPPFAPGREFQLGTTDAQGRFELTDALPEDGALIVRHAGHAPRYVAASDLEAESVLTLHLMPQASLRVLVVDESGAPVPEAWLRVDRAYHRPDVALVDPSFPLLDQVAWHGPTDAAGTCRIENLPTGCLLYVTALGELMSEAQQLVLVPGESERELTLYTERPGSLSGTLVHADETPAVGVHVVHKLQRWTGRFGGLTYTDEEGRFLFRDVAAGPGRLELDGITIGTLDVDVVAGSRVDVGAIEVPSLARASGRLVSPTLDEFRRFTWKLSRRGETVFGGKWGFTRTGAFTLHAPPGEAVLGIYYNDQGVGGDGHEVASVPLTFPSEGVEIPVPDITGTLRAALPAGAAGSRRVDVRFFARDDTEPFAFQGGAGYYGLPVVDGVLECEFHAGRYAIEVQIDARARCWIPSARIEAGGTTDLGTLALEPARLQGAVRDRSGAPVAGASVVVRTRIPEGSPFAEVSMFGNERPISLEARTAADGAFRFEELGAGWWSVRAQADGQGWSTAETIELLPGAERELLLELRPPGRVRGRVTRGGLPAPGWPVSCGFDFVGPRNGPLFDWNAKSPVLTDREGRFEIFPFEPWFYRVRVGAQARRFELKAGATVELDFALAREPVRVRLTDQGRPLDLSMLSTLSAGEPAWSEQSGRFLGAGWFEIEPLSGPALLIGGVRDPYVRFDTSTFFALAKDREWTGDVEIEVASGTLVLALSGPFRHADPPSVRLLSVGAWRVGDALAGRDLAWEHAGPDHVRYLSIPSDAQLLVEGLGSDGRTLRREVQYTGPGPLALEWPGDGR